MKKITLKDVAAESGFSFSLVSKVLRDKGVDGIPAETRGLIRDCAARLGYIANKNARSLKTGRTDMIAVVGTVGQNYAATVYPIITEAISRPVLNASSFSTRIISSYTEVFSTSGTKPAPIPCILCGPLLPSDNTGEEAGSTATIFTPGFWDFKYSPTPVIVPPVPTPETKISTAPSV